MATLTRLGISDALRSAVEASMDPAMAAADWLARDIDPARGSAVKLLTDPGIEFEKLRNAKDAYKTMRIVGETSTERRLAARLYAASIAAALVHYGRRVSRQSDSALSRGLRSLREDQDMPKPLRELAASALAILDNGAP